MRALRIGVGAGAVVVIILFVVLLVGGGRGTAPQQTNQQVTTTTSQTEEKFSVTTANPPPEPEQVKTKQPSKVPAKQDTGARAVEGGLRRQNSRVTVKETTTTVETDDAAIIGAGGKSTKREAVEVEIERPMTAEEIQQTGAILATAREKESRIREAVRHSEGVIGDRKGTLRYQEGVLRGRCSADERSTRQTIVEDLQREIQNWQDDLARQKTEQKEISNEIKRLEKMLEERRIKERI